MTREEFRDVVKAMDEELAACEVDLALAADRGFSPWAFMVRLFRLVGFLVRVLREAEETDRPDPGGPPSGRP